MDRYALNRFVFPNRFGRGYRSGVARFKRCSAERTVRGKSRRNQKDFAFFLINAGRTVYGLNQFLYVSAISSSSFARYSRQ